MHSDTVSPGGALAADHSTASELVLILISPVGGLPLICLLCYVMLCYPEMAYVTLRWL